MQRLDNGWEFIFKWTDAFGRGEGGAEPVRLPHNVAEVPLHYADPSMYETVCGYRRRIPIPADGADRRFFLQFDGAAHIATVYVNGREMGSHHCGYTAFRVEITDAVTPGEEALVSVKLDCTENPSIPPFGYVVDYLTYGGLYRDVWLDTRPGQIIEDLFIYTPDLATARVSCTAPGPVRYAIFAPDGTLAAEAQGSGTVDIPVPDAAPWDIDSPALYTLRAVLPASGDMQETAFGFRTARFQADGFYLNGKKLFLRGLNRHQSFPYIGYAAPERLQREDARILRQELACNIVRTSHYPQSPYFLDECDREGLLVLTEIPGWQHIGDDAWKDQACQNVREMVLQNRNHPSVILWGVRINESLDDTPFYDRTNAIAHELDPSRATTGIRYVELGDTQEDVFAFNDFSHTGNNAGVRPRDQVCAAPDKAFIVTENNGHMYPTKPADTWAHRQEHALRHARVMDGAMASGGHAGFFSWCMFDYATHKDFGSGDRICYHGVMDSFRNPKLAAALYASQGEEATVLEIGSSLDIGDYPGGNVGTVWVFTNAEEVAIYKDGEYVTTIHDENWQALPHGPMAVTGAAVPWWGGQTVAWRFDARKGGRTVASVTKGPSARLHLEARVSHTELTEGEVYDMAAVRLRLLDEHGSLASYAPLPVRFALEGPGALAGPETAVLEGGCGGTFVRTTGEAGTIRLTITTAQTEPVEVRFTVRR